MIRVVRLGTARLPDEGLRIGTVRRPPRGVLKSNFAAKNYFDVWLPELAPSAPFTKSKWERFARTYRREMSKPPAQRVIALLAALSSSTDFSIGCYCEDQSKCHRSLLRSILIENGAIVE